ncbi:transporter [Mitsuokella sp.]|jgi:predicted permease|uniref:AEC family transporter n=1 Tax=Mitsuokella sp. TaxID=2049034 RepID=UPI0029E321F5|nr:transporter [Mitsuokella sp.]MDD6382892.1 transporter [Selenomonadaceae bacterium]MDY4474236.1 transporter [Mitsuokella sp.]
MDNANLRLIFVVTDLIAPLAVGYFLHQRQLVSGEAINKLIRFNVICIYTILSLLSFWVLPISWSLLIVPIFGFLLILVPGAIGSFCFARRFTSWLDRGAYVASAMLANIGTLGGVCAFILYAEEGFAYTQIIGTCQNILLVLVIFPMAQYCYMKQSHAIRKTNRLRTFCELFFSINQLSLIGMAAGLLLNASGIARPAVLGPVFQSLVHIAAWIAMLPVGFLIDFKQVHRYEEKVRSLTALRFLITPIIFGVLITLFVKDPVVKGTLFICAFCPTAINAVLTSRIYHLTTDLAVSSFVITTTAFLPVIFPILFFWLR